MCTRRTGAVRKFDSYPKIVNIICELTTSDLL
jgi:hypothetical protein